MNIEDIIKEVIDETIENCSSEDPFCGVDYNGNKEETTQNALKKIWELLNKK